VRSIASRLAAAADGLSGEELALILAMGLVLGTFPVFGCPTILCVIAALALRLNVAALQLVNQLTSPLQLALLVPFARAGWRIPVSPAAPVPWRLGAVALEAITGWCFVCVPLGILLYFSLLLVLRRRRSLWCNGLVSPAG